MLCERIAFAVIMACINASIISFTLTAVNAGFPEDFLLRWGKNFLIAFTIVVPSIVFVGPKVKLFVERLFTKK